MTRYMLDTNICIYLIKQRPAQVFERFKKLSLGQVCISAITYSELQFGVSNSKQPAKNAAALNEFLAPIEVLDYPATAAAAYGEIRAKLKSQGQMIGANDLLLAAHAITEHIIMVTNNQKEFDRVDALRVENWV